MNKQIYYRIAGGGTIMQSAEDMLLENGSHRRQDSNCVRGLFEQSSKNFMYLNRKEKNKLNAANHL